MRLKDKAVPAMACAVVIAASMVLVYMMCSVCEVHAAATVTRAEAVAWAESKADEKAKVGSGQCVALIYAYYQFLGYKVVYGNATDFQSNALPDKDWKRLKNKDGFKPKPGDIAVWAGNTPLNKYYTLGKYGHVGIVRSGNATDFKSVEQHVTGLYTEYCSRPTSYVTCWIRPKWKAADVPADDSDQNPDGQQNPDEQGGGQNPDGQQNPDEQGGGQNPDDKKNGDELEFDPEKMDNPLTVKGKTLTVKRSYLKRARSYKVSRVLKVSGAKGAVTFRKIKGSGRISVNKGTGRVTVGKRLKKGTYKIKVEIRAKGNKEFNPAAETAVFKVKVK